MIIKASQLKEPVLFWIIIENAQEPDKRPFFATMEACSPDECTDRIVDAMNSSERVAFRDMIIPIEKIGAITVRQVRERIY